ncbi:PriCT-2 domain-containing protein [Burkholderia sp. Nafp2/4-1b]|uniref:PriCT-2 domain-containing protein n=1 Tax=Burkholderia sp. Nafp2/4-1b TaxID=2116686 RepID=UPI001F09B0B1|nr:PriCT-2 domain-containing protein [Burkholderia sp. Nafp2/4-1b]
MSAYRETERIRAALGFVPPDCRDTWVQMGMAVKAELGETGFDLWNDWSRAADSYSESDARTVWRSFKGMGITAGTLFDKARTHGYVDTAPTELIDEAELERRRTARQQEAEEAARQHAQAQANAADKATQLVGEGRQRAC